MRVCPRTGEVLWETDVWDSVRSDSHQVSMRVSSGSLMIAGSPSRVMGDGDAVFGPGEAGRDLFACALAMVGFVGRHLCISPMPDVRLFAVTRADVTCNYMLSNLASVRVALSELRGVEGGRYRVSQTAGDTVYWSQKSAHRSGKAYAKGPHLSYLMSRLNYSGKSYTVDDIELASRLLRLELRLGRRYFYEVKDWYRLSWADLKARHDDFFMRMLGCESVEGVDMGFVDRLCSVAPSRGQGLAAARTWALIQSVGWQSVRDSMPRATFYRHLAILRLAGLGDADLSAGRIISLRRPLVLRPVSSWEELRRVA